jgi:hypothetical protein
MTTTKATSQNWGKRKPLQPQHDLPTKNSFQYLKDYLMTKLTLESLVMAILFAMDLLVTELKP